MTEDYVSFEIAKKLKEKEFPQDLADISRCYALSNLDKPFWKSKEGQMYGARYGEELAIEGVGIIAAPTLYIVQKWLRETKDINLVIEPASYNYVEEKTSEYKCSAWFGDNYFEILPKFKTYEEALSEGINRALEQI